MGIIIAVCFALWISAWLIALPIKKKKVSQAEFHARLDTIMSKHDNLAKNLSSKIQIEKEMFTNIKIPTKVGLKRARKKLKKLRTRKK